MNIIMLFFYLFVSQNYKKKIKSGKDERLIINVEKISIQQINEMLEKKKLLDFLQSNKIGVNDKINKIKETNNTKLPDITKGGLLDAWNFDI